MDIDDDTRSHPRFQHRAVEDINAARMYPIVEIHDEKSAFLVMAYEYRSKRVYSSVSIAPLNPPFVALSNQKEELDRHICNTPNAVYTVLRLDVFYALCASMLSVIPISPSNSQTRRRSSILVLSFHLWTEII